MRGAKHFPRHSEGKADVLACREGLVKGEEDATGGNIAGESRDVAVAGGQQNRQRQWKPNGASNFLVRLTTIEGIGRGRVSRL
jgi:hypothetical protein